MNSAHDELVKRGAKWLKNQTDYRYRSPVVLTEFVSYAKETPDIIGLNHNHTTVIECKVSLSDFKADLKKSHRKSINSLGNWRFYLCPAGLISQEAVPDDWGLLYCYESKIAIVRHPLNHGEPDVKAEEYHILYSLLRRAELRGLIPQLVEPLAKNDPGYGKGAV